MRNQAIKAVPPALMVETAKGATAHVMPRAIKNDVLSPSWFAWGKGKAHAFLIPNGILEAPSRVRGKVVTVCKRTVDAASLNHGDAFRERCKTCTAALAEDTRKRGTGLSEPATDNVATGVQHGSPKEAEARRAGEIAMISGEASKDNAEIVTSLREGRKSDAMDKARELDNRGPAAPVPQADRAPIGNRDHGRLDGVAMVQGPNMEPVRKTWRNPATGEIEPAAARLDGSLRERVDREVLIKDVPRQSKASKRRKRRRLVMEQQIRDRMAARGESLPKPLPKDAIKREVQRLREAGKALPKRGW